MTIASRLCLLLPCCLFLFSIPSTADAQHLRVRKPPGRYIYNPTTSGITATETEAPKGCGCSVFDENCGAKNCSGSAATRWKLPAAKNLSGHTDGTGDDISTAYSHVNSRGNTYYADGKGGRVGWDIGPVGLAGWDIGPVGLAGWDIGPVGLAGWDVGPVGLAGWDIGPVGSDVDSDKCNCRVVRKNYLPCPCSEEEEEEGTDGASPGVDSDLGAVAIEYAMMASLMGYSDSEAIEYGLVVALIDVSTSRTASDSGSSRTGNNVVVIWP